MRASFVQLHIVFPKLLTFILTLYDKLTYIKTFQIPADGNVVASVLVAVIPPVANCDVVIKIDANASALK